MRLLAAVQQLDRLNEARRTNHTPVVMIEFDWGGETFGLGTSRATRWEKNEIGAPTQVEYPILFARVGTTEGDWDYGEYYPAQAEKAAEWLKNFVELHNSINVPVLEGSK